MKKKLVIGITIIVCLLLFLFIMGIFLVNQDEKSLKQLKNEIDSIDSIIENEGIFSNNIDKKLKNNITSGDFVVVEKAVKNYFKDFVFETRKLINIYGDEDIEYLFSIENYKKDGKDFIETLVTLRTLENKVNDINDNLEKLFNEDKIMSYIDSADSYYKDYYRELMVDSDAYENIIKDINGAKDIYVNMINTMEDVFKFLSDNKDKWNIEEDTIVFENDEDLNKYNELINKIGNLDENEQNI